MKKKKWYKSTTLYFTIVCIITLIIIALPLFLRCPSVYSLVKEYLSVFKSIEYKNTYIGTLGAVLGAFLGVTGAIWVQNIANKQSNRQELEKNARMVIKDCEIAFEQIKLIVSDMWEDEKMLDLSDDGAVVSRFNDCLSRYRFSIIPEWRQTLLSISELLESSELRQALIIYNNLSQIESISCKVPSRNELKTVFSKIITMIDSEESSSEAIIVKKEIQMVLDAINEVAGEKRV